MCCWIRGRANGFWRSGRVPVCSRCMWLPNWAWTGSWTSWTSSRRCSTTSCAAARRISTISATRADAHALPFEDASFDAVYTVTVLGEIPDTAATLREVRLSSSSRAASWWESFWIAITCH
ncbi:class I SAM-dependent methyltransferase [Kitasatospora sp. NPDC093102]|uniref:class I SAM-dependent methyltransferase n=1 Tax=Kitasatospora sp. NPDC093102 TaxID=3155069 RepID=UPI0034160B7A